MILKTVLTLSCRNASWERGCSINKNVLDVNMSQDSVIPQWLVKYHMIANNLTPSMIEISKVTVTFFKVSQMRYADHLEEKHQVKLTNEQQIQKEFLQTYINHLEQKIQTVEKNM